MNIDSEYSKMVFDTWINMVNESEDKDYHVCLNSGNMPIYKKGEKKL